VRALYFEGGVSLRYIIAFIGAPLVVFGLLVLMIQLIEYTPLDKREKQSVIVDEITFEPPEEILPEVEEQEKETEEPVQAIPKMPSIEIKIVDDSDAQVEIPVGPIVEIFEAPIVQVKPTRIGESMGVPVNQQVQPLLRIEPDYPKKARRLGIEGWVELLFDISSIGEVDNIRVVKSEPNFVFERAAKKALAQWKYRPMIAEGKKMTFKNKRVVINFNLN